ncbi:MAG: hypothetical protein IJQ66_06520 [Clostridia bacterium]|nr:hypothetical protein [Clostridia bacterium]
MSVFLSATRLSKRRRIVFNTRALKRRIKTVAETLVFSSLLLAAVLIALNGKYRAAVSDGIGLWAANLVPALFPYIFITYILSSLSVTDKISYRLSPLSEGLFKINGNGFYALLISLLSGYPLGAKTVCDLRLAGKLGKTDGERTACVAASSSPVFAIGCVGNIAFNDPLFGVLLYCSHLLAVLTVGFIFSFYKRKTPPLKCAVPKTKGSADILADGIPSSVISVLTVGGIVTVFYLLTEILKDAGALNILTIPLTAVFNDENIAVALANGFFECTKGITLLAGTGLSVLSLPLCGAMIGFGGISVIAQCCAFLKKAKINAALFVLSRLVCAAFGFIYGYIFSVVFF